jgi:hypothetical protein
MRRLGFTLIGLGLFIKGVSVGYDQGVRAMLDVMRVTDKQTIENVYYGRDRVN